MYGGARILWDKARYAKDGVDWKRRSAITRARHAAECAAWKLTKPEADRRKLTCIANSRSVKARKNETKKRLSARKRSHNLKEVGEGRAWSAHGHHLDAIEQNNQGKWVLKSKRYLKELGPDGQLVLRPGNRAALARGRAVRAASPRAAASPRGAAPPPGPPAVEAVRSPYRRSPLRRRSNTRRSPMRRSPYRTY